MKKGFFILLFVVVLHSNSSWSQANLLNAKVPQEVGMKVVEDQSPIAYGYIDDRDVLWSKTIWEIIDLNERINFPYYYPTINNGLLSNNRKSLFRILYDIQEIYHQKEYQSLMLVSKLQKTIMILIKLNQIKYLNTVSRGLGFLINA